MRCARLCPICPLKRTEPWRWRLFDGNASPEGIHQVHDVRWCSRYSFFRQRRSRLLLLEDLDHRLLVVIDKRCRLKISRLAVENMLGELEHVGSRRLAAYYMYRERPGAVAGPLTHIPYGSVWDDAAPDESQD